MVLVVPRLHDKLANTSNFPSMDRTGEFIRSLFSFPFFELFFSKKKISLSRRVEYVVDGWFSERCMYVTPIRLDLLNTNQISCCKEKI